MNKLELPLGQIQKIYSTSHWISFSLFDGKKRHFLYLGRGSSYEGIGFGEGFPPPTLRVKDRFLEYLRAHLEGGIVNFWGKDELDRILFLETTKKVRFAFFWKGPVFYFLHHFEKEGEEKLFLSWRSEEKRERFSWEKIFSQDDLMSFFDEVGRAKHEGEVFSKSDIVQKINEDISKYEETGLTSTRKKFFERKLERIKSDIEKVSSYEDVQKKAFECLDFEEKNELFSKSKRLKKAKDILEKRLIETYKEKTLEESKAKRNPSQDKILSPIWRLQKEEKRVTKKGSVKIPADFFLFGDIKMGVGISAEGNDYLRNAWGAKEDWWFHMEGERSAHVVVKIKNLPEMGNELWGIIAGMIADYSKMSFEEISLIFTQVKNLKGLKGKKGAVLPIKPRYLKISSEKNWKRKVSFLN